MFGIAQTLRLKDDRILFQDDEGLFFDDLFFAAWIRWCFPV